MIILLLILNIGFLICEFGNLQPGYSFIGGMLVVLLYDHFKDLMTHQHEDEPRTIRHLSSFNLKRKIDIK